MDDNDVFLTLTETNEVVLWRHIKALALIDIHLMVQVGLIPRSAVKDGSSELNNRDINDLAKLGLLTSGSKEGLYMVGITDKGRNLLYTITHRTTGGN